MNALPSRSSQLSAAASRHATLVWLLLLSATALAWWLVEQHRFSAAAASTAAMALAAFKVRLVFLHFMELHSAPLRWRLAFEAWVLLFFGIIVLGCWL
jgi:heme/copper-type cytochrome/quinol oxidase subunit 4